MAILRSLCLTLLLSSCLPLFAAGLIEEDESKVVGSYGSSWLRIRSGLTLEKDRAFRYDKFSCMHMAEAEGTWHVENGVVVLSVTRSRDADHLDLRYVPVTWESETLLVPENMMPAFAATLPGRTLAKTRALTFVKRVEGKRPEPKGNPEIPVRYEIFRDGPITAEIVNLAAERNVRIAKFDSRLKPGMILACREREDLDLLVLEVNDSEATAKPLYYRESRYWANIGRTFTTGDERRFPRATGSKTYDYPGAGDR